MGRIVELVVLVNAAGGIATILVGRATMKRWAREKKERLARTLHHQPENGEKKDV